VIKYSDGVVYVGYNYNLSSSTSSYIIYSLNATDGTLKWSFNDLYNNELNELRNIYITNNRIYILTDFLLDINKYGSSPVQCRLYSLDSNTGELLWEWYKESAFLDKIAVSDDILMVTSYEFGYNNNLFYSTGHLYALDTNTGELLWEWKDKWRYFENVLISDDTLSVWSLQNSSNSIFIDSISLNGFETNWNKQYSSVEFIDTYQNSLYVYSNGELESFDIKTGELKWNYYIHDPIYRGVSGGNMYFSTEDKLYSIKSDNGKLNWIFQTQDTYKIFNTTSFKIEDERYDVFQIIFLNDTLYITSKNDYLYNINPDGNLNWGAQIEIRQYNDDVKYRKVSRLINGSYYYFNTTLYKPDIGINILDDIIFLKSTIN